MGGLDSTVHPLWEEMPHFLNPLTILTRGVGFMVFSNFERRQEKHIFGSIGKRRSL
jgi:hypothetical protein